MASKFGSKILQFILWNEVLDNFTLILGWLGHWVLKNKVAQNLLKHILVLKFLKSGKKNLAPFGDHFGQPPLMQTMGSQENVIGDDE